MPGNVQNAAPATVLPQSLCAAFVHDREYPVLENEYRNGESQRVAQATNSRKRWRLAKRLTPTLLAELRDFYVARNGPHGGVLLLRPVRDEPQVLARSDRHGSRWPVHGSVQQPVAARTPVLAAAAVQIELIELA